MRTTCCIFVVLATVACRQPADVAADAASQTQNPALATGSAPIAAAASPATLPPATATETDQSVAGDAVPVVRKRLAQATSPISCAAPSPTGLWVALQSPGKIGVVDVHAETREASDDVTIATAATSDMVRCAAGGSAFWLAYDGGTSLAAVAKATVRRQPARSNVLGIVAQPTGDAVVAAAPPDARTVELVRMNAQLEPQWQQSVTIPGPVTAVSATLRDDLVLAGRSLAGAEGAWWLLRAAQRDGAVAWTRQLDAKTVPAQLVLVAAVPCPTGVLLAFESSAPARGKAPVGWTLVTVDANGTALAPVQVPQLAPHFVAAGNESAAIWAQTRGHGLVIERAAGYGEVVAVTAPWAAPESPQAIALGRDGSWWAVSAGSHADGKKWTVMATRFLMAPPTGSVPRDRACEAQWTLRDGRGSRTLPFGLQDGSPCGQAAECQGGQCRPNGR